MATQAPCSEIENFKRTTAEDSAKCQPRPSQALRGCVAHTPPKATLESQIPFTPVVIPEFWGAYRGCAGDKRHPILGVHGPRGCRGESTSPCLSIISPSRIVVITREARLLPPPLQGPRGDLESASHLSASRLWNLPVRLRGSPAPSPRPQSSAVEGNSGPPTARAQGG